LWKFFNAGTAVSAATLAICGGAFAQIAEPVGQTGKFPPAQPLTAEATLTDPVPVGQLQPPAPAAKSPAPPSGLPAIAPAAPVSAAEVAGAPPAPAPAPELPFSATAPEVLEPVFPDSTDSDSDRMAQVTSVSQLSDVQPTDWAFQALQNLVERYGCIAGYPDSTFWGNRAMTRYEFAAGLNACLERIVQLIGGTPNTSNLATKQDLALLQRLTEEFQAELAALRGRADTLEARTAELEANQFSTTTKLHGLVNFVATDAIGEGGGDNVPVFQQRVRLSLNTSFTGKDLLVTRIATGNSRAPQFADTVSIPGSFFPDFGTREGVQTSQWYGDWNNSQIVGLVTLHYWKPMGKKLLTVVEAYGGIHADYAPSVNPYFEDFDGGRTTLSIFAQRNPIKRIGGGSGVGFLYNLSNSLQLSAGYLAGEGSIPAAGNGFFDGDSSTTAQLTWKPSKNLGVALTYNHAYFGPSHFAFGDNSAFYGIAGYTGTGVMYNRFLPYATVSNSYGGEVFWKLSPKFGIGGWVGATQVQAIGDGNSGDADVWNYALTLTFPDLGKKGNLGGIVVGAEPYLGGVGDVPLHVEGFYKYQVTDNISITPGVIWLTAPNQNADNKDAVIGTLRTTFEF
jgi:hypothetical protein